MANWGEGWNTGENRNAITDIKLFFDSEDAPLKEYEFKEFWMSLSEEEKAEFRKADLS